MHWEWGILTHDKMAEVIQDILLRTTCLGRRARLLAPVLQLHCHTFVVAMQLQVSVHPCCPLQIEKNVNFCEIVKINPVAAPTLRAGYLYSFPTVQWKGGAFAQSSDGWNQIGENCTSMKKHHHSSTSFTNFKMQSLKKEDLTADLRHLLLGSHDWKLQQHG